MSTSSPGLTRGPRAAGPPIPPRNWRPYALTAALLAAILLSAHASELDLQRFLAGLPRVANYLWRTLPTLRASTLLDDLAEWFWAWRLWGRLLLDTMLIGYVGTVLGAAAALALSLLAAANTTPGPITARVARTVMDVARSVPVLVFGLMFVFAFGLGPLPGALALAVHSAGALGKLFTEVHENAAQSPIDGVRATGAAWSQTMRYGVFPQSLPGLVSYALLRFEINVREAAVLGFVGAGGIGQELYIVVRRFEYQDISAIVLMILAMVATLDVVCGWLRRRVTA